ncbi:MAG TPA: hypothetical protein VN436_18405, partial [Holophaga sp.]|nr:hypothetical protein [Holophaga sp.]
GWTAVDFIFPVFLFLVGVSVALAVPRDAVQTGPLSIWPQALKRAATLFGFGLLVNGFPSFHLDTLRIPGVLQRIAVVYLAVLWLHLHLGKYGLSVVIAVILLGYWLLWSFVPVPGLGFPTLDYEYNLESWLDQMFMRGHLWEYDTSWDPEGILSTLPCIALALLGTLAGRWLRMENGPGFGSMLALGVLLHLGGLAWDKWFPINKIITTSSFVLFVGGAGLAALAVLHRLLDDDRPRPWLRPVLALGKNALFLYVLSELLTQILFFTKLPGLSGGRESLHFWLFDACFGFIGDKFVASFAWGITWALLLCGLAMIMDSRNIKIRL